jgi:hypothetical protein
LNRLQQQHQTVYDPKYIGQRKASNSDARKGHTSPPRQRSILHGYEHRGGHQGMDGRVH